jgi:succinate-acetate transporter protein
MSLAPNSTKNASASVNSPTVGVQEGNGPAGRSAIIGMPMLMAGSLGFALAAFGGPSEALTPILLVAAVVGILAARYASRVGELRHASIFAAFSGFWLSYSALILGLTHNWYGIAAEQTGGALAIFLGSWLVVTLAITVSTLSLPMVFTVLLALFDSALVLLLIGAIAEIVGLYTAAGIAIALFSLLATYIYLVSSAPSSIRRKLPLGAALMADE